jgi:hypothetical protein
MSNKLPKSFKQKWIKALRSGKFKQGNGCLHRDGRYCCLGVACAVSGMKHVPRGLIISRELPKYDDVPDIIRGSTTDNSIVDQLVNMNDFERKDFNEIADYIQKNL